MSTIKSLSVSFLSFLVIVSLAGCGSGGGISTQVVSGVAAAGATLASPSALTNFIRFISAHRHAPELIGQKPEQRLQIGKAAPLARVRILDRRAPPDFAIDAHLPEAQHVGQIANLISIHHHYHGCGASGLHPRDQLAAEGRSAIPDLIIDRDKFELDDFAVLLDHVQLVSGDARDGFTALRIQAGGSWISPGQLPLCTIKLEFSRIDRHTLRRAADAHDGVSAIGREGHLALARAFDEIHEPDADDVIDLACRHGRIEARCRLRRHRRLHLRQRLIGHRPGH